MNKLLQYINALPAADRDPFARRCGTTEGYLRKAISKGSRLGPALSVAIEQQTGGAVTRKDLHPDTWAAMWPELMETA